ncbi:MAG: methyltransferase domain-containing protein [Raineya sp.]|nr:methyltransferase domain-containing protein [Raineya sp.]
MKTYLNLGCGQRFHPAWTNIDFVSQSPYIQAHNLLDGIPFPDESFEVVYHSHLLEHFTKTDGKKFLQECYRVLKSNGIIRVAVPDLERIVKEYLKNLELALQGDIQAQYNYEWIILEMYDQAVRTKSGGDMAKYIFQPEIPNEHYVFERIGEEGRLLRKMYLENLQNPTKPASPVRNDRSLLKKILSKIKSLLKNLLLKDEIKFYQENLKYAYLGQFRLSGEVHQWMYDRYSLSKLLQEVGFRDIEIKTAFESNIPAWNSFELESKNGVVFKPDSLFMEALK